MGHMYQLRNQYMYHQVVYYHKNHMDMVYMHLLLNQKSDQEYMVNNYHHQEKKYLEYMEYMLYHCIHDQHHNLHNHMILLLQIDLVNTLYKMLHLLHQVMKNKYQQHNQYKIHLVDYYHKYHMGIEYMNLLLDQNTNQEDMLYNLHPLENMIQHYMVYMH